jgi:hypothetical protein
MTPEKIIDNGLLLAMIVRPGDWGEGLNCISSDEDFLQVVFWGYPKGKQLPAHVHLDSPRQSLKTQEVVFVRQGRLRADIFGADKKLFTSVELCQGDVAVFLNGGHGYEILEDDTKVLEVKNGPYPGPEKDRERI